MTIFECLRVPVLGSFNGVPSLGFLPDNIWFLQMCDTQFGGPNRYPFWGFFQGPMTMMRGTPLRGKLWFLIYQVGTPDFTEALVSRLTNDTGTLQNAAARLCGAWGVGRSEPQNNGQATNWKHVPLLSFSRANNPPL